MSSFFDALNVTIPIVQAPMAGAQDIDLPVAVSNAGAVASLPCALLSPNEAYTALNRFRSRASGPINLNFFVHEEPSRDSQREEAWLSELVPFYEEFGLEKDYEKTVALKPLSAEMVEVVCATKPEVVSFHFGLPDEATLSRIRSVGSKIISSATTVREARYLEQRRVDAIVTQGTEAGGHRGTFLDEPIDKQMPLQEMLTVIRATVHLPVIAAGGVSDVGAVRNAMQAGADGVQVGTRFLKTPESRIAEPHRAILESSAPHQTQITNVFTGRPARSLENRLIREAGPINPAAQAFPLATAAISPLKAATKDRSDFIPLWAGQNWQKGAAMPAAEVVAELAQGLSPNNN